MFGEERQVAILNLLSQKKRVTVQELAEQFKVSEVTIRRDLNRLADDGFITRTYGGAMLEDASERELSFEHKKQEMPEIKELIAQRAASLVTEGDTIALDASTITYRMVNYLKGMRITIITNSLDIAQEVAHHPDMTLILCGGILRHDTRALMGPVAERQWREYRADLAFIGCNAVHPDFGVMTTNAVDTYSKRAIREISKKSYMVAETAKFGRTSLHRIFSFSEIDGIITDVSDPNGIKRAIQNIIKIVIAKPKEEEL
ncbi:DeoR/GlpR family DNA-binding transcription regulator [Gottschalkiaceae bacterium SANA]|nr:DeoR/GlpR family DNA-binding transcription regulator [Gottschalkiaceae bacterium SANA]